MSKRIHKSHGKFRRRYFYRSPRKSVCMFRNMSLCMFHGRNMNIHIHN